MADVIFTAGLWWHLSLFKKKIIIIKRGGVTRRNVCEKVYTSVMKLEELLVRWDKWMFYTLF